MPPIDSQETAQTPVNAKADDAALAIYDQLSQEGFDTADKIAVVKAIGGLVRSDIDEQIKQLQRLKTGF